ncbi:MAG: hypothetical protein C5B53_11040 [Candidatus Melainabacteria bacterium]|nr:MAG: hypothetical protein C5B53_11040 [Candidatus Melainabacteria bacterium]
MKLILRGSCICLAFLFLLFAGGVSFMMPAKASARMPIARIAGKNLVHLEVAATESEIERGLMYRTFMPEDNGMVFLFSPPRPVKFWMYHTLISLDMCFIHNGKIVKICEEVPPCRSENPMECPTYPKGPGFVVSYVLELNGGYAKRHGIKEGDEVVFELPDKTEGDSTKSK